MNKIVFFEESDNDILTKKVNDFFEKHTDIKIVETLQTGAGNSSKTLIQYSIRYTEKSSK